jgi:hypothetical protein
MPGFSVRKKSKQCDLNQTILSINKLSFFHDRALASLEKVIKLIAPLNTKQ